MRFSPFSQLTLLLFLILFALPLFGQEGLEAQPESPEILLPAELLRVDTVPFEQVDAILPEASSLVMPDFDVQLPPVEDQTNGWDLQLPDSNAEVLSPTESSLFSSLSIAAGSRNHIEGSLGVFKLGQDPRFRFSFSHFGLDGYGNQPAGVGFFRSDQKLGSWVGGDLGPFSSEAELEFREWQEGLQRRAEPYYSTVLRFLEGKGKTEFRPDELVGVYGLVNFASVTRRFTVSDPELVPDPDKEISFNPTVTLAVELERFVLALDVAYNLQDYYGGRMDLRNLYHDFLGQIRFDAQPAESFGIYGQAGVYWPFSQGFEYPLALGADWRMNEFFELGGEAGYRIQRSSLSNLWNSLPLMGLPQNEQAVAAFEWYAGANAQMNIPERNIIVNGSAVYIFQFRNRLLPNAYQADPSAAESFGFAWNHYDGSELQLSFSAEYQLARLLRISAAYDAVISTGETLQYPLLPAHALKASAEYTSDSGLLGGGLSVQVPVYSTFSLPLLDLHAFVHVVEGVVLRVSMEDILAPIGQSERWQYGYPSGDDLPDFSPFIEPGFRIFLGAEVTL